MSKLNITYSRCSETYNLKNKKVFNTIKLTNKDNWKMFNMYKTNNYITHTYRNLTKSTKYLANNFPQKYVPNVVEKYKYNNWLNHQSSSKLNPTKEQFKIILPPPNITGTLHLGHALTITIQDILVRWHKMRGIDTLWIPGMDHAGIATQVIVEKKLWKERKIRRIDIGREGFQKEVFQWKKEKEGVIREQIKKLGAVLDWDKEYFTMDQKRADAVTKSFIKLFEMGLIYRSNHLVNWSCVLQSAISDIEVEYLEIQKRTDLHVPNYDKPIEFGTLTKFAYKLENSSDTLLVCTTRPETILGDVALAVHPSDDRYLHLHNKYVVHPFRNELIPIITDDFVDQAFGTGVVKITPAHDPIDFEVGKRHNLRNLQIINENGYIIHKNYENVKRFEARKLILQDLDKMGLLHSIEDHAMKIPLCSRSKDVIEYMIKPQWFINCKNMAEGAIKDVKSNKLKIVPPVFEKTWFNWLENIRDWCISRQLWWGHQIPAYECYTQNNEANKIWVAAENSDMASKKGALILKSSPDKVIVKQDSDVLDTWFSSSILPFSSFGWPESEDFKNYPLTLMETGHDIIFFWVARMVMLGKTLTSKLPFSEILLHGIICDVLGRKMSKSLGNVIFPEDVIEGISLESLQKQVENSYNMGLLSEVELNKAINGQRKMFPNGIPQCGADALRFTLVSHNIKSHFINFDIQECHTNALFCNKIWQACKFIHLYKEKINTKYITSQFEPNYMDKWILSRLSFMISEINGALNRFDFHVATAALKQFLYSEFCDIYVESTKPELKSDQIKASNHLATLILCLEYSLRCLSPFMPFLSEELYMHLPAHPIVEKKLNVFEASFPESLNWRNEPLEREINMILDASSTVRRLRKLFNINSKDVSKTYILSDEVLFKEQEHIIRTLSNCSELFILKDVNLENIFTISDTIGSLGIVHVEIPQARIESVKNEQVRLNKKIDKLSQKICKMQNTILTDGYKLKAPIEVQKVQLKQLDSLQQELEQLKLLKCNYSQLP